MPTNFNASGDLQMRPTAKPAKMLGSAGGPTVAPELKQGKAVLAV
jgi:hypothetical protein